MELTKIQRKIGLLTLVLFALLYFLSSNGINCSNDGSHFALSKSIYYNKTTEITPFFGYVKGFDYAVKEGHIYSDRLPDNAVLMLPFLVYSNLFKIITNQEFGNKFEGDVVAISFLPNLCGLIVLVILFFLFRKFGFDFNLSFIATVIYGIATLHWFESRHAFSHAPSIMFITFALYLTVGVKDIKTNRNTVYQIAGLIGFSTLLELQNILFLFPVFLYLIVLSRPGEFMKFRKWIPTSLWSFAIVFFFVGCLVFYNYLTFGEFLLKSNALNPNFPEEKTFRSALEGNFWIGVDKLLTNFQEFTLYTHWRKGVGNDIPGLFASSPILILSAFGMIPFLEKNKKEALLFLLIIGISIVIAALHKTTLTRHIATILPLFYFPIVYLLQWVMDLKKFRIEGIILVSLFVMISTIQVGYMIYTYFGNYNHGLFTYRSEILYFFLFYIPILAIILLCTKLTFVKNNASA